MTRSRAPWPRGRSASIRRAERHHEVDFFNALLETAAAPMVRIQLLGGASLTGAREVPRLEKKSAALLAYLALEGTTSRSRLSGLLWPESREATGRNNLAQVVRRLKQAAGTNLIAGDTAVELIGAEVDVRQLLSLVDAGQLSEAARLEGELLGGVDLDGCADLEVWLAGARGRVRAAWMKAADAELSRCEREGDLAAAADWAARWLAVDPLSEAAHLRLARLHLERGDAAAAMAAYEACRKTLAKELAIKPSAAMQELLRAIKEARPHGPRVAGQEPLPARVLHPPWVGRAREWAELERACSARVLAIVEGEPGVGKSRLLRELAAARGRVLRAEGRPGDPEVPFATIARFVRELARDRRLALPPWAKAELARVAPELLGDEELGVTSTRSRVRFFEAVAHAIERAFGAESGVLVLDDLQWMDAASLEVLFWVVDRSLRSEGGTAVLAAHRAGELAPEVRAMLERAETCHPVVRIALGPLEAEEIASLVDALALPFLDGKASAIAEASRGVPLFALELVRALSTSGDAEGPLPMPDKVRVLLQRRIAPPERGRAAARARHEPGRAGARPRSRRAGPPMLSARSRRSPGGARACPGRDGRTSLARSAGGDPA
jgi:DNA-binding SARP family transcriptional activator